MVSVEEFYKDSKGDSVQSLGWGSTAAQRKRFSVIAGYLNYDDSILDVGCGYGDLAGYLFGERRYKGIDVREEAIKIARQRHKKYEFETGDIFGVSICYDWVIASGIFCFEGPVKETLEVMFEMSNKGVIANFLYGKQDLRSFTIAELEQLALPLTEKFAIRHDYLPNDSTLILYK